MKEDLAEWLLAQIAEDEGKVRGPDRPSLWLLPRRWHGGRVWLPARIRDECATKRRLVELHEPENGYCSTCLESDSDLYGKVYEAAPCMNLRLLALPFADRPGYREEWRP